MLHLNAFKTHRTDKQHWPSTIATMTKLGCPLQQLPFVGLHGQSSSVFGGGLAGCAFQTKCVSKARIPSYAHRRVAGSQIFQRNLDFPFFDGQAGVVVVVSCYCYFGGSGSVFMVVSCTFVYGGGVLALLAWCCFGTPGSVVVFLVLVVLKRRTVSCTALVALHTFYRQTLSLAWMYSHL